MSRGITYRVTPDGDVFYEGEDEKLDAEISPLVGFSWQLGEKWSLYGSYTDYLIPQAARSQSGGVLDPTEVANMELGIKGEVFGDKLIASLAVFRLEESGRPMADPNRPPNSPFTWSLPTGKTRSQGVELELNGLITSNWSMNFGYTYNTTEFLKDDANPGQPFATFTPRHILKLWSNYRLPVLDGKLWVGVGVIGQSELNRPLSSVNGVPTQPWTVFLHKGGYVVTDIRVNYAINETWTLGWNWNNIFDKIYYAGSIGNGTSGNHFYGEPRNVMFTLRAKY